MSTREQSGLLIHYQITEYAYFAGEVVKQTLILSGLYVDFSNMANGLTLKNVFS